MPGATSMNWKWRSSAVASTPVDWEVMIEHVTRQFRSSPVNEAGAGQNPWKNRPEAAFLGGFLLRRNDTMGHAALRLCLCY